MKRYVIYDFNDEVIESTDNFEYAVECADLNEAQLVLDTNDNQIVWGADKVEEYQNSKIGLH